MTTVQIYDILNTLSTQHMGSTNLSNVSAIDSVTIGEIEETGRVGVARVGSATAG